MDNVVTHKADREPTVKAVTMLSKAMSALEADMRPTKATVDRLSAEVDGKQSKHSADKYVLWMVNEARLLEWA